MDKRRKSRPNYSKKWNKTSTYCLKMVDNKCILCYGVATLVHHAFYTCEISGWSIFPVCEDCHKKCHLPEFWINNENKILSRNTQELIAFLRAKYYNLYCTQRGLIQC